MQHFVDLMNTRWVLLILSIMSRFNCFFHEAEFTCIAGMPVPICRALLYPEWLESIKGATESHLIFAIPSGISCGFFKVPLGPVNIGSNLFSNWMRSMPHLVFMVVWISGEREMAHDHSYCSLLAKVARLPRNTLVETVARINRLLQ